MRGCHGNHSITHRPNELILEKIRIFDSVDPNKHFGTHEESLGEGAQWTYLAPIIFAPQWNASGWGK